MIPDQYVLMIKFGDNDFHSYFCTALRVLRMYLLSDKYTSPYYSGKMNEYSPWQDKDQVARLLNYITPTCYQVSNYLEGRPVDPQDNSLKYCEVSADDLLIGKEVDDYLQLRAYDGNGSWFVLDMRLPEDQQIQVW